MISVVVVLHRSAAVLPGLLAALPAAAELIVADTGPDDGARALVDDVLVLPEGTGFGAANNAGVARAGGDVTILLNPDTVPRPGAVEALAAFARERDALHVPRLLDADGVSVQDSAHPRPGGLRLRRERPWRSTREREVGWAIAACLAARTATLRALGPFDPGPHLFYEDLDLCLRAPVATVLHPSVEVVHLGGHATGGLDRLAIEARRRREVVGARLGRRALLLDDLAQAVELGLRAPVRPRARAQLRALHAARRTMG